MAVKKNKPTPKPIPSRRSKTPGPKAAVIQDSADVTVRFYFDVEQRTCLLVKQDADTTSFIPMTTEDGLAIVTTSTEQFKSRFKLVPNHDLTRGAKIYLRFATEVGATREVMAFLAKFTPTTQQEIYMATNRKTQNDETKASKKPVPKVKAEKPAKVVVAQTKTAATPAKAKTEKPSGEKKLTASKMFQDLIMEGKFSDDKIFEKVQAKFGLDDNKRSYVKWYRNDLKKKGMNPPEGK